MADTYYAWSPIRSKVAEGEDNPHQFAMTPNIQFGEKVDQKKLGISDGDWQELVDSNAIRNFAPPDMSEHQAHVTPVQAMTEKLGVVHEVMGGSTLAPDKVEMLNALLDSDKKVEVAAPRSGGTS